MCYNSLTLTEAMSCRAKRPTIKDIAKISGFSTGTVDRALHDRGEINPRTKQKILEVAQLLGYETNCIASVLSRKKPLVFAAIFPRELHYFYDDIRRGFLDATGRLRNFKVVPLLKEIESLGRGEEEALEALLGEEIDGVVFTPGHRSRFDQLINSFAEQNIPVVTVSTDAPKSRRLTAVCVDPWKNGELAGELMSHFIPEGGRAVVMAGSLEIEDHFQKAEGFKEAIAHAGKRIKILEVLENQEDETQARRNFLEVFQRYPDLEGVYIATANSIAICEVLAKVTLSRVPKVIATDLFNEMIPYFQKGVIHATIFQNPYRQGFEATFHLFRYLVEGIVPPPCAYLEPIVVMRSNLEFYLRGRENK
ncbi:MAG: LacI family DNA-binding transcriptional regulator [Atribacterota bacterium]|nr:LacI family DNA-binding transcriptional regulator [Atribacterota bacterium]